MINDGLTVFFFLLAGMKIKRELVEGHLSTFRHAALPAYAAAGDMGRPGADPCVGRMGKSFRIARMGGLDCHDIVLAVTILHPARALLTL